MATVEKKFHFASDAEGWVATAGGNGIDIVYQKARPHNETGTPNSTYGGCLRTTAKAFGSEGATENYWEWTGTWEDLGVTAGQIVTKVNVDYSYRWFDSNVVRTRSVAVFGATDCGSGPMELRDSGGTLIDTISTRVYAPERTLLDMWGAYPRPSGWPFARSSGHDFGEYPISETPTAWAIRTGTEINVPSAKQASNTTIKLRLRNCLPQTSGVYHEYIKFKQDRVVVTMTLGSTYDPTQFFPFFG